MIWAAIKNFLSLNSLKILGWLMTGISVAAVLLGAKHAGRVAERADQLKHNARTKDAMLKAAINAPDNRDSLVDQLRDGNF